MRSWLRGAKVELFDVTRAIGSPLALASLISL
jgi:hypothetical protein